MKYQNYIYWLRASTVILGLFGTLFMTLIGLLATYALSHIIRLASTGNAGGLTLTFSAFAVAVIFSVGVVLSELFSVGKPRAWYNLLLGKEYTVLVRHEAVDWTVLVVKSKNSMCMYKFPPAKLSAHVEAGKQFVLLAEQTKYTVDQQSRGVLPVYVASILPPKKIGLYRTATWDA